MHPNSKSFVAKKIERDSHSGSFMTVTAPGGKAVRVLNREVYERAIKKAGVKVRASTKNSAKA